MHLFLRKLLICVRFLFAAVTVVVVCKLLLFKNASTTWMQAINSHQWVNVICLVSVTLVFERFKLFTLDMPNQTDHETAGEKNEMSDTSTSDKP